MATQKKIRVLMTKAGLDAHERGLMVVCMGLKDEGFEVIYAGLRQTPEAVLQAAIQEDADVLGVSSMCGAHNVFIKKLTEKAKAKGIDFKDMLLVAGGIIPDEDVPVLKEMGVSATFGPGTPIRDIASFIRENVTER
ncbi:MAG: cobalamin B12-binding domain-containing protein [Syntrophaceae bacterium]|nr:cobalamin B12-binding domain-containing protein [Syntrophaceae bacterium]